MSDMFIDLIKCEKCGHEFEGEIYNSVNGTIDPELKQKVMNFKIYMHKCPNCGNNNIVLNPIIYHDMDKKVFIQANTYSTVINDMININDSIEANPDYKFYGATSATNLRESIIALDNNLDIRTIELMKVIIENDYNSDESKEGEVDTMVFDYNDKSELSFYLPVNKDDKEEELVIPFDYDLYNKINNNNNYRNNSYIFDRLAAQKMLTFDEFTDEELDFAKKTEYEFVVYVTENNNIDIAFVQSMNNNKFKKGDMVAIALWSDYYSLYTIVAGKVLNVFHSTDFDFPREINDLNVAIYKLDNVDLPIVKDTKGKLNNKKLLKELVEFGKSTNRKLDYKLFDDAYAILAIETNANVSLDIIKKILNGDSVDIDDINTAIRYKKFIDEDERYLSVYLNEDDIKDDNVVKVVCKFSDIVKLVFNMPDEFEGICINPETERLYFPYPLLIDHSMDRIMLRPNEMRKFLFSLTNEEIEFLGRDRFDTICMVYNETKTLDQLKAEENLSDEDLQDRLSYGYALVKHIIKTRLNK